MNKGDIDYLNQENKNFLHIIEFGIKKGVVLSVLFFLMPVLSACGNKENTAAMSASGLVEEIPEDDAHAINAQRESAEAESAGTEGQAENAGAEGQAENAGIEEQADNAATSDVKKGSGKSNTAYKSETAKIEGETTEVKEISISALEALSETENLTEEKRKELLCQALIDSGKDPSIAEGKYSTNGLYFEVPENFALSESNPNMYVTRRYSLDISNIYYQESEVDYLLQLMTEESYQEMALETFKETYGMDVDLKIDSFEEIEISGIPSFQIESRFDLEGITIRQTTFIVNADKTYMLVYTTTDEYDTGLAFEDSKASIRVKK